MESIVGHKNSTENFGSGTKRIMEREDENRVESHEGEMSLVTLYLETEEKSMDLITYSTTDATIL